MLLRCWGHFDNNTKMRKDSIILFVLSLLGLEVCLFLGDGVNFTFYIDNIRYKQKSMLIEVPKPMEFKYKVLQSGDSMVPNK